MLSQVRANTDLSRSSAILIQPLTILHRSRVQLNNIIFIILKYNIFDLLSIYPLGPRPNAARPSDPDESSRRVGLLCFKTKWYPERYWSTVPISKLLRVMSTLLGSLLRECFPLYNYTYKEFFFKS